MKSAFERALERFGENIRELTPEQKERIAEIDRRYDAKIAEIRLGAEARIRGAADPEKIEAIRAEAAAKIADLNRKRDREKERVRSDADREEEGSE